MCYEARVRITYELTICRGAIYTARIIDFPRRISIARALAKPWMFICNLMNGAPRAHGAWRIGARSENSEFDPSILPIRTTATQLAPFDRIENLITAPGEFAFSASALQTNRFAILNGRFELADTKRRLWQAQRKFYATLEETVFAGTRGR